MLFDDLSIYHAVSDLISFRFLGCSEKRGGKTCTTRGGRKSFLLREKNKRNRTPKMRQPRSKTETRPSICVQNRCEAPAKFVYILEVKTRQIVESSLLLGVRADDFLDQTNYRKYTNSNNKFEPMCLRQYISLASA